MQIAAACDENTIGVAAILGTTYTGAFDDVAGIDAAISCAKFRHCTLHEQKSTGIRADRSSLTGVCEAQL